LAGGNLEPFHATFAATAIKNLAITPSPSLSKPAHHDGLEKIHSCFGTLCEYDAPTTTYSVLCETLFCLKDTISNKAMVEDGAWHGAKPRA